MPLTHGSAVVTLPGDLEPGLLSTRFELRAHADAVADARRRVRRQLRRWAFPPELCDTAQLLVSELFTNAVLHTDSATVGCVLRAGGNRLRVEVRDTGSGTGMPAPRDVAPEDERGRGLLLVDTFAEEWGVERAGPRGGCLVWFALGPVTT
ncbi:ATP-binding protein [Streptomyces sp. TR06-5]|uniref:ATP-binding protein n=1 Tax=unclassified Streptomyces TaxID=2593676 RepID=UPI0039A1B808